MTRLVRLHLGTAPGQGKQAVDQSAAFKRQLRSVLPGIDGVSLITVADHGTMSVEAVYDAQRPGTKDWSSRAADLARTSGSRSPSGGRGWGGDRYRRYTIDMPNRTLEAVAFWLAVTAAALLLAGAVGKLANTGELDLRPLALGLVMTVLAVSIRVRRRVAASPPA